MTSDSLCFTRAKDRQHGPVSTCDARATGRTVTTPADGACTGCSSFIASSVSSSSPARTRWPGTTSTRPHRARAAARSASPRPAPASGSGKRGSSLQRHRALRTVHVGHVADPVDVEGEPDAVDVEHDPVAGWPRPPRPAGGRR